MAYFSGEEKSGFQNCFRFSTDVRVRFAETDAQRIAHNSTYLVWFEVARVAYLDEFTAGYRAFQDAGYEATVFGFAFNSAIAAPIASEIFSYPLFPRPSWPCAANCPTSAPD